jgi:hypothetical protein
MIYILLQINEEIEINGNKIKKIFSSPRLRKTLNENIQYEMAA